MEEYVDNIDGGLATFHCKCGQITAPIELGLTFICKGCERKIKVCREIKIEEVS